MTTSIAPFTCFVKVSQPGQNKWEEFWLQVQGFLVFLAKKIGQPCHFMVPLDLVDLRSGETETGNQNTLYMESSTESGGIKLLLASTSRVEIILLYRALFVGCGLLKTIFEDGHLREEKTIDFISTSRFSKNAGRLTLTGSELTIARGSEAEQIPMTSIISMSGRQNDQNCQNRLVLVYHGPEEVVRKEFSVAQSIDLWKIVGSFLMHRKDYEAQHLAVEVEKAQEEDVAGSDAVDETAQA